jgi:aerobic carbon-monoxide dehydrogenase medium subunit
MKPPPFRYHDPHSVGDAVDLLARLENVRLLAGGQSLMPMLNMRYVFPDHLIDLNRIDALVGIESQGDQIRIGAMTRQRDIQDHPRIRDGLPLLLEALNHVGHRQTRNRGTIGGSLCHLDPTAELVAVANNLDATVEIAGPEGTRELPVAQFAVGFMTTALEPGEMVVAVRFPVPPSGHGFSFVELARRHGDFALVSAATMLVCDSRGRISRAAITVGGIGPVPHRLVEAEKILLDGDASAGCFAQAAQAAASLEALDDAFVPAWYRQQVAAVMVRRGLAAAHERAQQQLNRGA